MSRIKLLPEDLRIVYPHGARWLAMGHRPKPFDITAAQAALNEAHAYIGWEPPKITLLNGPSKLPTIQEEAWLHRASSMLVTVSASVGTLWADNGRAQRGRTSEAVWFLTSGQLRLSLSTMSDESLAMEKRQNAWPKLRNARNKIEEHCGWVFPCENAVYMLKPPFDLHTDEQGRPHHWELPAIVWEDQTKVYAWKGLAVTEALVKSNITVTRIDKEQNLELKRVMIERYGPEKFMVDGGAKKIATDDTGILWHRDIPGDEPMRMVEVINSTPEPDGTYKHYWLRVPPSANRPKEAVAWTFGKTAKEYAPAVQT